MNNVDKQYQELLKKIIETGCEKESGRENMPNTIGISNSTIYMDLSEGFPLLTTKKMYWKGIIHELLWFLRGDTNIKYLVDNDVNIWNGDAYRWYQTKIIPNGAPNMDIDNFINEVKKGVKINISDVNASHPYDKYKIYQYGDLGKVYGYQWRNQNGVDQVGDVINGLKTNPYSRYHIIDGWNKADFPEMALPPCHLLYQFICRPLSHEEKIQWVMTNTDVELENLYIYEESCKESTPKYYLDLNMYQRSCDTFLGVPFNLASMSLLLHIIAKTTNMVPGIATWIGGDTHLYVNHIPMAEELISRDGFNLCHLNITKELNNLEDILNLTIDDFVFENYISHPPIKAELFTGNKK